MMIILNTLALVGDFPVAFTAVYVVGFIAAVVIGSIAWSKSKRPPGWEEKEPSNPTPTIDPKEDS